MDIGFDPKRKGLHRGTLVKDGWDVRRRRYGVHAEQEGFDMRREEIWWFGGIGSRDSAVK